MSHKKPRKFEFVKCWTAKEDTIVVVIPKKIREDLAIRSGDRFFVTYNEEKHLIFKKMDESYFV